MAVVYPENPRGRVGSAKAQRHKLLCWSSLQKLSAQGATLRVGAQYTVDQGLCSLLLTLSPVRTERGGSRLNYTRIYADSDGESHLEDVEVGMSEVVFAPPAPPLRLSEFMESSKFSFLSARPGWFGDWHPAPKRQFMLFLQGEIEVEVSDGEVRCFGPGSATLLEDTGGKGHRSRVLGDKEAFLAVVQLDQ